MSMNAMSDKPENWMEQAVRHVQDVGGPAAEDNSLRRLWQSSVRTVGELRQEGDAPGGRYAESLKTLFDPSQWAQAGLGPLDAAIEHLVDGPSYATLWTLDRKILKAQKLRGEWAKDLAAYQILMHGAWNEAIKRFLSGNK